MDVKQGADTAAQLAEYMPIYFGVREILESTRTFLSVMTSIVVFEHLSTMPQEIKFVWRTPMSFMNACLLINRYGIIAELSVILYLFYLPHESRGYCEKMYLYEAYMPSAILVFGNLLLLARVYALWKKSKLVLAIMLPLLAALIAIHIWVPTTSHPMPMPPGIPALGIPDIRACLPGNGTPYFYLYFVAMLVFDTTAFVLSVIPCLREKMILRGTGITQILIRDGIIYFALCFAANLANVIYYAMSDDQHNRAYLASLATGIQAMASSRLVFNLRQSSSATTTLSTTGRSISGFRAGTGQWDIPLSGTAGGPHHPTSSSSDAFKSPLHYGPDTEKDDFHEVSDTYAV